MEVQEVKGLLVYTIRCTRGLPPLINTCPWSCSIGVTALAPDTVEKNTIQKLYRLEEDHICSKLEMKPYEPLKLNKSKKSALRRVSERNIN